MRWSQLKKRAESFFCDAVRRRVELRMTRYHKAHDQMGRAWITVDKREIINMDTAVAEAKHSILSSEMEAKAGCTDYFDRQQDTARKALRRQAKLAVENDSVFTQHDLWDATNELSNSPIDAALQAQHPLTRALAVLDRRAGKQRLKIIAAKETHPLVLRLLHFRFEAERSFYLS